MVNQPSVPPLVVSSFNKRLVAHHAHTGQRVWEFDTGLPHDGRLLVEYALVIYAYGSDLLCLDYPTGALRWKAKLPVFSPLLVVFAGCVVATASGEAVGVDVRTGALLWHDELQGYGLSSGAMAAPGVAAQVDHH